MSLLTILNSIQNKASQALVIVFQQSMPKQTLAPILPEEAAIGTKTMIFHLLFRLFYRNSLLPLSTAILLCSCLASGNLVAKPEEAFQGSSKSHQKNTKDSCKNCTSRSHLKKKRLSNRSIKARSIEEKGGSPKSKAEYAWKKGFSKGELLRILKEEGYPVLQRQAGKPILFRSGGHGILLQIYEDGDLQLLAGFRGYDASLERINRWNRSNRLSRAYLDSEGGVVLTADLFSNGGLNRAKVRDFINLFSIQAGRFEAFLEDRERP